MSERKFSHISENGEPSMVDVGHKKVTERKAVASTIICLGEQIISELKEKDLQTKKGPVFQIASLAGIMGAKKTSDLIPLCHQLSLNKVDVDIKIISDADVKILCTAKTSGKTGVEMEALTGASIAALTIYDMCKSMSHEIIIRDTRLVEKSGGKKDYNANKKTC